MTIHDTPEAVRRTYEAQDGRLLAIDPSVKGVLTRYAALLEAVNRPDAVSKEALQFIKDAADTFDVPPHLTPSKQEYVKAGARLFIVHLNKTLAEKESYRATIRAAAEVK